MRGYKILQDGLTLAKAVRREGEVVMESTIPYDLLERLRREAPEPGDVYRGILEHIEVDEASLADLLLKREVEEEGVEFSIVDNLQLTLDVGTGRKIWRGIGDERARCGFEIAPGQRCAQVTQPGEKCRHHKGR